MSSVANNSAQSLAGGWAIQEVDGNHAFDMSLPGDIINGLHAAGQIPDPYWGRNEYDLRWIALREWTATRTINLDEETDLDLVLSGLDTVASVRLNGALILSAKNSFRTYRVPLGDAARLGENTLEITFHSNPEAANTAQEDQPFKIPYLASNCPIPNGNMLRKVQCDFGWDWNIALAPFGVYGAMALEPSKAPRIDRVSVSQDHGASSVTVNISAHTSHANGEVATISFAGREYDLRVENGAASVAVTLDAPALWWPVGLGEQVLYDLDIQVGEAKAHRKIGLRKIELLTTPDAAGSEFKFRINGHDTFMKGANWIPQDALPGRVSEEATRDLLQSAVDANMNMLRIWGGGRYEPTWFYDICDEMGLLIWQDFMFACNLYPSTPEFLEEVEAEVKENVARLHHHASIAVWCGDNELIGALGWFPESRDNRDQYLVNYDRLNRCIEGALRETDAGAIWWPSSPSPGPMNFGDAWHDDGAGDMHFWSVWHEGKDFDHYRDVSPRFCSEFGFQSYPSIDVIKKFTAESDRNIAAPVLESHQKNKGGNARIAETMFRYFRWPERFEDFVYLSQVQQGLAIKTAVTHWRALKPHCMGTLVWQLNDTWPVCSWASLDHGGGWKLLHHMTRHFNAPVFVSAVPEGDNIVLRGVNDGREPVELSVQAVAVDVSGPVRELGRGSATIGGGNETLLTIAHADLNDSEMLAYIWEGSEGTKSGDIFAPKPYKAYDLQPAGLSFDSARNGDEWVLTVAAADAPAFFVAIESTTTGRFSDNAFALFPGSPAEITFTPENPDETPEFLLRDLYSATTAKH